jgi:hypothetical protein
MRAPAISVVRGPGKSVSGIWGEPPTGT